MYVVLKLSHICFVPKVESVALIVCLMMNCMPVEMIHLWCCCCCS